MTQAVTNTSVADYQHMDTCLLGGDWISFQNSRSDESSNPHMTRRQQSMRLMSYHREFIQLASFPRYTHSHSDHYCVKQTAKLQVNSSRIHYQLPLSWNIHSSSLSNTSIQLGGGATAYFGIKYVATNIKLSAGTGFLTQVIPVCLSENLSHT